MSSKIEYWPVMLGLKSSGSQRLLLANLPCPKSDLFAAGRKGLHINSDIAVKLRKAYIRS